MFLEIERNKLICVEPVNEKDAQKVREHVLRVMREVGAEQLRTDELSVYEHIVPEEHHSICLAHWRKSKCRRGYELYRRSKAEGLEFEAENMWQLLQHMERTWQKVRAEDIDGNNNATERIIGLDYKIRAKTMRAIFHFTFSIAG